MITKQVQFFSPLREAKNKMSRCHCQVAGNIFPVGSSQGAASALQWPSRHIEVICSLQHRGFSAFPSTLLKPPDFNFTGTCSLICSWWRSQIRRSYRNWEQTTDLWFKSSKHCLCCRTTLHDELVWFWHVNQCLREVYMCWGLLSQTGAALWEFDIHIWQ